jgi:hypothetical protein
MTLRALLSTLVAVAGPAVLSWVLARRVAPRISAAMTVASFALGAAASLVASSIAAPMIELARPVDPFARALWSSLGVDAPLQIGAMMAAIALLVPHHAAFGDRAGAMSLGAVVGLGMLARNNGVYATRYGFALIAWQLALGAAITTGGGAILGFYLSRVQRERQPARLLAIGALLCVALRAGVQLPLNAIDYGAALGAGSIRNGTIERALMACGVAVAAVQLGIARRLWRRDPEPALPSASGAAYVKTLAGFALTAAAVTTSLAFATALAHRAMYTSISSTGRMELAVGSLLAALTLSWLGLRWLSRGARELERGR